MHAAATTGPASGAQPASSTPASGCGKSSSSLNEQRRGIESLCVPLQRQWSSQQTRRTCGKLKISILHPPRRKTPRFARFVEKDDVAVGVAEARFAPHPGLIARAVLERDAAAGELL